MAKGAGCGHDGQHDAHTAVFGISSCVLHNSSRLQASSALQGHRRWIIPSVRPAPEPKAVLIRSSHYRDAEEGLLDTVFSRLVCFLVVVLV